LHRTSRRLTGGILALGLAAGVSACGTDAATDTAAAESGWEFTDDLGTTIALDEVPTRVAGLNDVLSSLWNYGIEPVASWGQTSIEDDVAFEGKDLSGVEIVGTSYGQIDLEALAADPDVIVASVYPTDSEATLDPDAPFYGFESIEQQEQVAQIAPIIGIAWRGSAAEVIERTVELAGSLGMDVDGREVAQPPEQYDAAAAELTEAAARGVSVLPVFATAADGWWMAKAADDPSLHLYQDLGVTFVDPGGQDYFWNSVGWERSRTTRAT
jgi:iron complex transport system substrate-binding protein